MHFGFLKDCNPGYGEDAMRHGEHYAIVCDGLGGMGANVLRKPDGTVRTEAYVTSNASVQLVEEIVLAQYPDWKTQLTDPTLASRIAQMLNREILKRIQDELANWQRGAREPIMPSTFTCAVVFPEARRALILWAGDSRVYMLDREHFYQLSKDDGISDPPMDVMEELMFASGSPPIGNRIGLDMPINIHSKMIDLPEQALILCTSDGIYNCLSSPMFEEYLLRSCYKFTSSDQLCEMLCQVLSRTAQDDIAFAAVYVDAEEDSYPRFQEMLRAGLEGVKRDYISAFPASPPSTEGYLDEDLIRARIFERLYAHDGFQTALHSWLRRMEDGAPISEKLGFATQIQNYRKAKENQQQLEQLRASQAFLQKYLPAPTEEEVRRWLSGLRVTRKKEIPTPPEVPLMIPTRDWATLARNYSKFKKHFFNLIDEVSDYFRHCRNRALNPDERRKWSNDLVNELNRLGSDQTRDILKRVEDVFEYNEHLREDSEWLYKEFSDLCNKLKAASGSEMPSVLSFAEQNMLLDAIFNGNPLPETNYSLKPADSEQLGLYRAAVRISREHARRMSTISSMPVQRPSEQKFDPYTLMQIVREWIAAYCSNSVIFPIEGLPEAITRDLENLKRAPEVNQAITQATQAYEDAVMSTWRRYKVHYERYMYADVSGKPLSVAINLPEANAPVAAEVTEVPADAPAEPAASGEAAEPATVTEAAETAAAEAAPEIPAEPAPDAAKGAASEEPAPAEKTEAD